MSINILSTCAIFESSSAGINNPEFAISVNKPIVLNADVFPPVFGPVIIKMSNSFPNSMSIGIGFSIKGCFAFLISQ